MRQAKGLEGKRALITGGTAGIGAETARLFVADGAEEVVIAGRDAERGAAAVADIGGPVRFVRADLADLDSVAALAAEVGDVDVLVNNAGAFPTSPTLEQTVEGFERMFDTNVRGLFFLTKALVPAMLAKGEGAIVNTTTIAAMVGVPGAPVYSSTKAAVAGLTRTWAAEWSSQGVRVNSISPGPVITEGVVVEWGEGVKELGSTMPIGRTGEPEEIAEAILFLASPRSSYVTGATLAADGGGSFH
jgi:NAD(P)-dependent dehydrogenase (short-subunit alcohol dehydrogenase family)